MATCRLLLSPGRNEHAYSLEKVTITFDPNTQFPGNEKRLRSGSPTGFLSRGVIGGGRGQWFGGTMASAEHEPITGVWGQSPQRGPGAEPLVRG